MNEHEKALAVTCLEGAEKDIMTFPQIVRALMAAGFESYEIDFRRRTATYYSANGESVELATHSIEAPVASGFDSGQIRAAIEEAQQFAPGYTYKGFCRKVAAAGCAGYVVSFLGRRALYIGRTAETHVEHFPG